MEPQVFRHPQPCASLGITRNRLPPFLIARIRLAGDGPPPPPMQAPVVDRRFSVQVLRVRAIGAEASRRVRLSPYIARSARWRVRLAPMGASTAAMLGPGVTNPATRDISVTASAAATLQEESEGRAVLGFARGDSALRQIDREPVGTREFETALERVVAYLAGEQVRLDGGTAAEIAWIEGSGRPPIPVFVAASGARTIAAGVTPRSSNSPSAPRPGAWHGRSTARTHRPSEPFSTSRSIPTGPEPAI